MNIAHESAAYLPQPGRSSTSAAVIGFRSNHARASAGIDRDRCLQKPSGLSTGHNDRGRASASVLIVCVSTIALNAGQACSHVVLFTRQHASNIQNGRRLRRSWKSRPDFGRSPSLQKIFFFIYHFDGDSFCEYIGEATIEQFCGIALDLVAYAMITPDTEQVR